MAISKKHFLPEKKDRKNQYYHPIYKMASHSNKEYQRIEDLLDEATCDVINGVSKSDILLKFKNGLYENMPKGVTIPIAEEYYKAILSRLQIDEPEKDNARQVFYGMYLNLYKEQLEMGNHIGAKQTLDSMVKLMGLDKATNQTNIQVNSNDDGKIQINFKLPTE